MLPFETRKRKETAMTGRRDPTPGRGDQRHWFDAQEAAVEIFGRDGGCVSNVVTGIEPMAGDLFFFLVQRFVS